MEYPADDGQSLLGRKLIHARRGGHMCHHSVIVLWSRTCAVLVRGHCRLYSGVVRSGYHFRVVHDSSDFEWLLLDCCSIGAQYLVPCSRISNSQHHRAVSCSSTICSSSMSTRRSTMFPSWEQFAEAPQAKDQHLVWLHHPISLPRALLGIIHRMEKYMALGFLPSSHGLRIVLASHRRLS